MQNNLKVIFWGTPDFAIHPLSALMESGYSIIAIITQPNKITGRKKLLKPPPVKVAAQNYHIPVLQPNKLKDDQFFEEFKNLAPDICIVGGYGKIIPERYLLVPKFGFICVHPSLLPKYRGPSPIQGAIMNGEPETGIGIIIMDKEMDHGPILSEVKYHLKPTEYKQEAEQEIWKLGGKLLIETLPKYIAGKIKPRIQNHEQATFTKLLTREDARTDWSRPPQEIYNKIRALNPEPGTWTTWNNKVFNIKKAKLIDGKLTLITVQLEGKKETPMTDFLSGHPDFNISQLK